MDMTRPPSGHDQADDPIKIKHPEEEEHHESRASKMFGKVKARAKKFKNSLTKHGNEQDHDVVEEEEDEDDENDEAKPEKQVAPVNEVSAVRSYRTSQPESLSHPRETNVPAPEEIIPSETKDSNDDKRRVEPEQLRDATYEHEAPSYPVRTSDVTTPGEDEFLHGQREVNTERPKRLEDDLSGESTYQSKIPNHTQQGSGEAGEDDQKTGLGTELESESGIGKDSPGRFGGESETEFRKDLPTRSFEFDQKIESGTGDDLPTGFDGNPETGPREDFPDKSYVFDQKIESGTGNDSPTRFSGKPETELMGDFQAKSHEFEQTIGTEIGKDTGGEKPGTERREDFLGKSYEFDQEVESAIGKDSPTRSGGESELDNKIPARSDDVKVETGLGRELPTGTNDQFSPEFSGPKDRNDFDSQYEAQPTTYTEMIGSATSFVTDKAIATKNAVVSSLGYPGETAGGEHKIPVGVETVAQKLTTDDENVKESASPVTTKLPLSGAGNGAEETEQGEDKGVSTRYHLEEKMTTEEEDKGFSEMVAEKLNLGGGEKNTTTTELPLSGAEETEQGEDKGVLNRDDIAEKMTPEEEDKAFSEMVAEKLNLGGGEKKTTTTKEEDVAVEGIPSDKLPEEIEHGEAVAEEGIGGGGGMVGKIKGAYNYWLGGTANEEVKPKSPVSVEDSSQSLGSTVGTKGFSDSGVSGLGETGGSTGDVPVKRGV